MAAAGINKDGELAPEKAIVDYGKLEKQYKKICSKKTQIESFFKHEVDLSELFKRAGNPDVLRMTGQPDTHLKFVDIAAYRSFKKFLKWYQPDVDLIFGDYLDCEGISHWPSDSLEPRRLIPEIKAGRIDLAHRKTLTPKTTTRIFIEGNHEDWIRQGLTRMPEFFEDIESLGYDFSVPALLDLERLGYDFFPVNHIVKIGKAHFTHGVYCPKGHANKHLAVFKNNIYYGHTHDYQAVRDISMDGLIEAASTGCLARLDAKFLRGKPAIWNHGFGIWEFRPDGNYTRVFISIKDGVCSYNGIIFDGNTELD